MDTERLLNDIIAWAKAEPNVRAAILTGSAARGREYVDQLSDLDVELFVRAPSELLEDSSWYEQFGEVLAVEALTNPGWHPTRLAYYVGGKVDFAIASISALATTTYSRPFQVLVDKDGLTSIPAGRSRPR